MLMFEKITKILKTLDWVKKGRHKETVSKLLKLCVKRTINHNNQSRSCVWRMLFYSDISATLNHFLSFHICPWGINCFPQGKSVCLRKSFLKPSPIVLTQDYSCCNEMRCWESHWSMTILVRRKWIWNFNSPAISNQGSSICFTIL